MKTVTSFLAATVFTAALGSTAFAASPDVYVVDFRSDKSPKSQILDGQLSSALSMVTGSVEHVVIDTTTAAKWEKGAHEAFDRDIVPVFNKWVGLPGFAAVVDARSKRVIGCVNGNFQASELASVITRLSQQARGKAYMSKASTGKSTACPPAFNQPPK